MARRKNSNLTKSPSVTAKKAATIELTYDAVVKWFGRYFKDACKTMGGPLADVPKLKKYFTPDFEFWQYSSSLTDRPLSREGLLMTMVHPGLNEELTPNYYAIDLKQMIGVVQFQARLIDTRNDKVLSTMQNSAHYHLTLDSNNELKIKKIQYWVENVPSDELATFWGVWQKYKDAST